MYRNNAPAFKKGYLPRGQCHFYLRHGYCRNLSICKWEHPELDETNAEYRYKSEHFNGNRGKRSPPIPMSNLLSSVAANEIIKQRRFRDHELQLEYERQRTHERRSHFKDKKGKDKDHKRDKECGDIIKEDKKHKNDKSKHRHKHHYKHSNHKKIESEIETESDLTSDSSVSDNDSSDDSKNKSYSNDKQKEMESVEEGEIKEILEKKENVSKLETKTFSEIKNEEQISECTKWIEIGCCEQFKYCPHFHEGVECDVWVEYGRCPQKEKGKCSDFHHRSIWAQSKKSKTLLHIQPPPPPPKRIQIHLISKKNKSKKNKKRRKKTNDKKLRKKSISCETASSSQSNSHCKHKSKYARSKNSRSRSKSNLDKSAKKADVPKKPRKDIDSDVSTFSFESLATDASDTSQRMHKLRCNVVQMFKKHQKIYQCDLRDVYYSMFKSEMNIEVFGFLNMISFLKSIKCLSMTQSSNGNLIIMNSLQNNFRGALHHFNYNRKRFNPYRQHYYHYQNNGDLNDGGYDKSNEFRLYNNQRSSFNNDDDVDKGENYSGDNRFDREPPMKKRKQEITKKSY